MLVCVHCKKEMICKKTGVSIRFNTDGSHVYPADTFECPKCGAKIAKSGDNSYYQPDAVDKSLPEDIWMSK